MSLRAKKLEGIYLRAMSDLTRETHLKKSQIGPKALAEYTKALIEECPNMNSRTCDELLKIAHELDTLS